MTDSPVTHHLRRDLSIDQQLALKTAANRLEREFDGVFGVETIERFLHSSYDQFAGRATVPNFLPCSPNASPPSASTPWPASKARSPTANPPCCSCAPTTPAALRWRSDSSPNSPATTEWRGQEAQNPETKSTPRPSNHGRGRGIDITNEYPKPGPTKSCKPPTSSSPWAAATPAPFFPASATRTGTSRPRRPIRRRSPTDPRRHRRTRPPSPDRPQRQRRQLTTAADERTNRPSVLFGLRRRRAGQSATGCSLMRRIAGDTIAVFSPAPSPATPSTTYPRRRSTRLGST